MLTSLSPSQKDHRWLHHHRLLSDLTSTDRSLHRLRHSGGTYDGYKSVAGQDGSTIYIKSTGEMIYLQGGAENSSESFSYTLSDGTTTDTATVTAQRHQRQRRSRRQ